MRRTILTCTVFLFAGCFSNSNIPQYTFQSKQEVVKENVLASPNIVTVPYGEGRGAVERLIFLFENGIKLPLIESNREGHGRIWTSRSATFVFRISESLSESGMTYRVDVTPLTATPTLREQAILNAKNLARFMSKGVFERSLFVP